MPHQSISNRQDQVEGLITEMDVLRRQVQAAKRNGFLFACIFAGLFFLGGAAVSHSSAVPDTFVLKDPVTKQRLIDMVTMNTGAAGFQVWDRNGTRRILLGTNNESQPGLTLWDSQGRQRILVGINNDDIPHITIWDVNNQHRIVVGLDNNNQPHVSLFDQNGNAIQ